MSLLDKVQIVLWVVITGVFLADLLYAVVLLSYRAVRQRGSRARLLAPLGMCAMFVGMATPLALPSLVFWISIAIGFCGLLLAFVTLVAMFRKATYLAARSSLLLMGVGVMLFSLRVGDHAQAWRRPGVMLPLPRRHYANEIGYQ